MSLGSLKSQFSFSWLGFPGFLGRKDVLQDIYRRGARFIHSRILDNCRNRVFPPAGEEGIEHIFVEQSNRGAHSCVWMEYHELCNG